MIKKKSAKKPSISEKEPAESKREEISKGTFSEDKVLVFENPDRVYDIGFYGKKIDERLELSLVEALFLLKKGRIDVKKGKKSMTFQEL